MAQVPPPQNPQPGPGGAAQPVLVFAAANVLRDSTREVSNKLTGRSVALFVVAAIVLYGAGEASTFLTIYGQKIGVAGLAAADFSVGALAFGMALRWTDSMRAALATALFIVYLAYLGNILNGDFYKQLNNDLGKQLLNILTASVTAVVGFYFASKTTEQVFAIRAAGNQRH
jgi:hypothetical protein